MKPLYALFFLPVLFLPATHQIKPAVQPVKAEVSVAPHYTENQHFSTEEINELLASTTNTYDLRKLISCESENTNVARMDSNHVMSFGILQFNGTATWQEFSVSAGVSGTPMNPPDAIKVADWMISHGYGHRWTCWRIQGLDA